MLDTPNDNFANCTTFMGTDARRELAASAIVESFHAVPASCAIVPSPLDPARTNAFRENVKSVCATLTLARRTVRRMQVAEAVDVTEFPSTRTVARVQLPLRTANSNAPSTPLIAVLFDTSRHESTMSQFMSMHANESLVEMAPTIVLP